MPTAEQLQKSLIKNSPSYREANPDLVQKFTPRTTTSSAGASNTVQPNLTVMESRYAGLEDKLNILYPQDKNADGSGVIDHVGRIKKIINLEYDKPIRDISNKFQDSQTVNFWRTLHKDVYAFADILNKYDVTVDDKGNKSIAGISEEEFSQLQEFGSKYEVNMSNAINSLYQKYDSEKGEFTDFRAHDTVLYHYDVDTAELLNKKDYEEKSDEIRKGDRFSGTIEQFLSAETNVGQALGRTIGTTIGGHANPALAWLTEKIGGWLIGDGGIEDDAEKYEGFNSVLERRNYVPAQVEGISRKSITSLIKNSISGLGEDRIKDTFGGSKVKWTENGDNAHHATYYLLDRIADVGSNNEKYNQEKGKKLFKTFTDLSNDAQLKWIKNNEEMIEEIANSLTSQQAAAMHYYFNEKRIIGQDDYRYYPGKNATEQRENMEVYNNTIKQFIDRSKHLNTKIQQVYLTAHKELNATLLKERQTGTQKITANNSWETGNDYAAVAHAFMLDKGVNINTFEEFVNDIPNSVYNIKDRHIEQFFPEISTIKDADEKSKAIQKVRDNISTYVSGGGTEMIRDPRSFKSFAEYDAYLNQGDATREKIAATNSNFYNVVDILSGMGDPSAGYTYSPKSRFNTKTKDLKKVYEHVVSEYQKSFNDLKADHVFAMTSMVAGFGKQGNYSLEVSGVNIKNPDLNNKNHNATIIMDIASKSFKAGNKKVLVTGRDYDYLEDIDALSKGTNYSGAKGRFDNFLKNGDKDRFKIEYINTTNDPSMKAYVFTNLSNKEHMTLYVDGDLAKQGGEMFASYEYNDSPDYGFDLSGTWDMSGLSGMSIVNPETSKPMLSDFKIVRSGPYKVLRYTEHNPNVNNGQRRNHEMILGETDRMMIKDARNFVMEQIKRYNQDYSRVR
jgi:hypothetical protein